MGTSNSNAIPSLKDVISLLNNISVGNNNFYTLINDGKDAFNADNNKTCGYSLQLLIPGKTIHDLSDLYAFNNKITAGDKTCYTNINFSICKPKLNKSLNIGQTISANFYSVLTFPIIATHLTTEEEYTEFINYNTFPPTFHIQFIYDYNAVSTKHYTLRNYSVGIMFYNIKQHQYDVSLGLEEAGDDYDIQLLGGLCEMNRM